jgi:hypothetical protein
MRAPKILLFIIKLVLADTGMFFAINRANRGWIPEEIKKKIGGIDICCKL